MNNVVQVFRSLLVSITGTVYRIFSAKGRADETLTGKMYQHYGFRSNPPADTELATLKFGNNIISVAENDGNTGVQSINFMEVGETRLYSDSTVNNTNNIILSPGTIVNGDPRISLQINSDRAMKINVGYSGQIDGAVSNMAILCHQLIIVQNPPNENYSVALEKLNKLFAWHVHPLYPLTPQITTSFPTTGPAGPGSEAWPPWTPIIYGPPGTPGINVGDTPFLSKTLFTD